jgi:hypothetical protein
VVCNPRKNALLKEGSKSDRIDAKKLAKLLRNGSLSAVYHEEHGLRMLKELSRSYLTISKDLGRSRRCIGVGPFPVQGRKSTHRDIVRSGSARSGKPIGTIVRIWSTADLLPPANVNI